LPLRTALSNEAAIEVVDPQPIDLGYERIEYHKMTAAVGGSRTALRGPSGIDCWVTVLGEVKPYFW
jgi:hypothetical protein